VGFKLPRGDDSTGSGELDGVRPPPGCDPTLVVWREYRGWRSRIQVYGVTFLLYVGAALIVEFAGPGRLDGTFSYVFDGVCLFFAVAQGYLMTNPGTYYAAGRSWLIAWTTKWRDRPTEASEARRGQRTLRFADLRQVELGHRTEGWTRIFVPLLVCQDVHGTRWSFRLTALQSCRPIVALFEPALDRPEVIIGAGVREALHAPPQLRGGSLGRAVLRAGSGL